MSRDRSRITGGRPPRTAWLALLAVIVVPVAVAWGAFDRGAEPERSVGPAVAAAATPSSTPSSTPSDEADAGGRKGSTEAPEVPAQEAPATVEPAVRPGQELDPDLQVADRGFGKAATYPDGVKVAVTSIVERSVEAMGPGSIGGPVSVFTIRVVNGTDEPLALDSVVLTAAYGDGEQVLAYPTYDLPVQDFAGTAAPGTAAQARYAFSIPAADRDQVTLHVDLDGTRIPATFAGSTR